ncbi:hypothetical protein [Streptomyces sp. GESEQ-35]|nr:hypothetical protein [Streptomyces sp. GESEQ-35]
MGVLGVADRDEGNVRTAECLADVLRSMSTGEELRARVRQLNREGQRMP